MLAGAPIMDHNTAFTSAMMTGAEQYMGNPYYPWNSGVHDQAFKAVPTNHAAFRAMSTTLAPSVLTTQGEMLTATPTSTHPSTLDGFQGLHSDPLGLDHLNVPGREDHSPYSLPSGQNTPGESFWSNFVQDGGWNDELVPNS